MSMQETLYTSVTRNLKQTECVCACTHKDTHTHGTRTCAAGVQHSMHHNRPSAEQATQNCVKGLYSLTQPFHSVQTWHDKSTWHEPSDYW